MEDPVRRIPLSEVIRGMHYCKVNALRYLQDARLILQEMSVAHAYVSVQIAIEELGKMILLTEYTEEARKNNKDEISIIIKDKWKKHDHKTGKAFKIIDPKLRILHKKTRLDKADTEVSNTTRLECGFAEYDEDSKIWWLGPVIDRPKLEALMNNVEEILKSDVLFSQLPF